MAIVHGVDSSDNVKALLLDASGNVIVSASQLTSTGGKLSVDASGRQDVNLYGLFGGVQRKSPLPFGSSGAIGQVLLNSSIAAGTNTVNGTAVPAGEMWVITNMNFGTNTAVAAGYLNASLVLAGTDYGIWRQPNPGASTVYDRQGYWILDSGDNIRLVITGGTAGANMFLNAIGFRLDTDQ